MFDGLEVVPMESVQSGRIIGMLQTIRKFIIDNYLFGEEDKLGNEDSFMETGIIDSTGILELVRFLESTYGIKIADEELLPDNLDSVNKIVASSMQSNLGQHKQTEESRSSLRGGPPYEDAAGCCVRSIAPRPRSRNRAHHQLDP
jgi:acyl carrier protein